MYLPSQFEETRPEVLFELMGRHPLATIVRVGADGPEADHIPLLHDPSPAPFGVLRGHVARGNPLWKAFATPGDVLVVFQGTHTYITPSWYPSKHEHGKVAPTWNYAVVHARGTARAIDDPKWLHALVSALTDRHEATRPDPWAVADAPDDYVATRLRAIVGIEITLRALSGKWKVSQNRGTVDRAGVAAGLRAQGDASALAMADMVERAGLREGQ